MSERQEMRRHVELLAAMLLEEIERTPLRADGAMNHRDLVEAVEAAAGRFARDGVAFDATLSRIRGLES